MASKVNGCGVKMASGSSGICAVGGLAETATTYATGDPVERESFILKVIEIEEQRDQNYHRSCSRRCTSSPRLLVTLGFRHRVTLVFAYAADVEFQVSILLREPRRADEAIDII